MATQLLPAVNGDGLPVVPMSEDQKYLFDLKGWIALPGLLDEAQLEPVREHQMRFLYHPEELPPAERDNHGGPSQVLLDEPAVVGVLNEVISHPPLAASDCYGFRFDHTYTSHRQAGHDNFNPHGGGGLFNFSGDSHWTNETRDRLSLFTCYNTVNAKWGKGCPPPEVIAAMPPLRRTLFRGVWHGMREVPAINKYHDEANTGRFAAG